MQGMVLGLQSLELRSSERSGIHVGQGVFLRRLGDQAEAR